MGTESRTNKKRFKRAAIPNNAKQRKRAPNTLEAIKSQAQDHVTKKKKRDHKERSFAQPLKMKVNPKEKKLKALAKKLSVVLLLCHRRIPWNLSVCTAACLGALFVL